MYYVTMQITFLSRTFRNGERNLHCDVVHITTKWVASLTLDCNGVFAINGAFECGGIDGKLGGLTPMNSYAPFVCIRGIKINRPRSLAVTRQRVG